MPTSRKKKVVWTTTLGEIKLEQQCFLRKKNLKDPSHRLHPLEELTNIKHRSYSLRCQRFMTDFGAEESFATAASRMEEHHGVYVNPTTVRRITEGHASRAQELMERQESITNPQSDSSITAEMDGGMVPLVESLGEGDKRKKRKCFWAELRVGTAQRHGELEWKYSCSFRSTNELGDRFKMLLKRYFAWQGESSLHCVGDGAKWITEQFERIAGSQFNYLIDMYHLCDYFVNAAIAWTSEVKQETSRFKNLLKSGKVAEVQENLKLKLLEFPDHDGLIKCVRYMNNRQGQFAYDKAIKKGLPIGSGKIESTHRHLIQSRLKKAGAWWKRENAAHMAELRVLRANGDWELLWQRNCTDQPYQMVA